MDRGQIVTIPDALIEAGAAALTVGEWSFDGQPVRRDEIAHAVLTATLAALTDENEHLREALRRHVMDWGDCDRPPSCPCSHATALRLLGEPS